MTNWISSFNHLMRESPIFWFSALSGSFLFVIQFFLNFLGGGAHDDIDDGGVGEDSLKVKWISKQAITGFLMMFGWVGLTCEKEFHFSLIPTLLIAVLAGVLAIFCTALIFATARKLRSSGNVFRIEDTVGREAIVYQRIPKSGIGKISISLHNLTYEIDAISQEEELSSFTKVHVLKKSDEKTVVVIPIK